LSMPYHIDLHKHRLAGWAAATAASSSILCRFKVEQGVRILETCGFKSFVQPKQLPPPDKLDVRHRLWRLALIDSAENAGLIFTHGVAAKLINCYLKVRFLCGGFHEDPRVQTLHPPIDEQLLKELAKQDFGGFGKEWRQFRQARWSKFDSDTYQSVIDTIRASLKPGEPLWLIEEHWKGYQ
jgi:hypothetical protein